MEFEYDPNKSDLNKVKHGIDFEQAKALWIDTDYVEIPVNIIDEPRYMVIGRIAEKYWSAVITYRNNKIGIISVRRSRNEEVKIYESA